MIPQTFFANDRRLRSNVFFILKQTHAYNLSKKVFNRCQMSEKKQETFHFYLTNQFQEWLSYYSVMLSQRHRNRKETSTIRNHVVLSVSFVRLHFDMIHTKNEIEEKGKTRKLKEKLFIWVEFDFFSQFCFGIYSQKKSFETRLVKLIVLSL